MTDALGLADYMLGYVLYRLLGTMLDALRVAFAKIALERKVIVVMCEYRPERARLDAVMASYALLPVYGDNSIFVMNGFNRAIGSAFGITALLADDRHPDHRMRIQYHHAYRALLGIVYLKVLESAYQLADLAT
jgi:hypothetical protein